MDTWYTGNMIIGTFLPRLDQIISYFTNLPYYLLHFSFDSCERGVDNFPLYAGKCSRHPDIEGIELIFAHEMMCENSSRVSECRRDSPELFPG